MLKKMGSKSEVIRQSKLGSWNLLAEGNFGADVLFGLGGFENIVLSLESQELSIGNKISAEGAHSEFEAAEIDARYALLYVGHQFKIVVRDYQRQTRDAVHQAVRGSSGNFWSFVDARTSRFFRIDMKVEWIRMKEEWHN